MEREYPYVVFEKEGKDACHTVYLPDFDVCTQGETVEECRLMAQDLVSLLLIGHKEDGINIPEPYSGDINASGVDSAIIIISTVVI